jgi:[acyl-carrier-protein] S-malonyltransferase
MKKAFIFPGQGSQFIGMGKDLAETSRIAKEIFQEIDDALSQNLSKIIFAGPTEDLSMTENTQPALMAVSLALIRTMEKEAGIKLSEQCVYVAGHSLGEYSALAAAGALSITDTARLLKIRGKAMQDAAPLGEGSMAAILADYQFSANLVKQAAGDDVCEIANYNSAEQIVISGHTVAIDRAITLAGEQGKRAIKLNVSAPFHSSLMSKASKVMEYALGETRVTAPIVPIVTNVTASETMEPEKIKKLLVEQVTGMVKWYDSIIYLKQQGVTSFIEIGAGKVLTGLIKRIDKDLEAFSVQGPDDIDKLLKIST